MFKNKRIAVVIPAYNEEKLVGRVIETMPEFVDNIIIINDGSEDKTKDIILKAASSRNDIFLIDHARNEGLGKSLIDGYLKGLESGMDIIAVMAGDAQMDPEDLPSVLNPVAEDRADYVKGNRLLVCDVTQIMPKYRFIGNAFLTLLSKFATGYWHVIDPQCGYTAISNSALKSIDIQKMTKRYGYNAHILSMLNLVNAKVQDVEVKPFYNEAKSKIRLRSYVPKVSWLLLKLYVKRMFQKYMVREFHPLVFFYLFGFANISISGLLFFIRLLPHTCKWLNRGNVQLAPRTTLIIFTFTFMIGFFSLFFGMWMDMEDNKTLRGK